MSSEWLYDKVERVPTITDDEIDAMIHITPVLEHNGMYREIKDIDRIDPRNHSFLWDAEPTGQEFTYEILNQTTILTQHHSSVFFKPSLAEVYAWIKIYMPNNWDKLSHFCLLDPQRVGSSCDMWCPCIIMGGPRLVRGNKFRSLSGDWGYQLIPG